MIGRLTGIIADLGGGGSRAVAGLLTSQLDAAIAATRVISDALEHPEGREASTRELIDLEHEGDRLRGLLVRELTIRIVTPIDREDLFRVSRSIDDILDNLRDFHREEALFQPVEPSAFLPVLAAAGTAMIELRAAITAIAGDPEEIGTRALAARKAGREVRRLYDRALGEVFSTELSMATLKRRELLRRLDVVGLRLREAADALADAAVKRGGT